MIMFLQNGSLVDSTFHLRGLSRILTPGLCVTSHISVPSTEKDSYSCSNKFELLVWYFHNSLIYCFSVEDDSAQVPFPELCGESVEYLERTSDAILALSNFRLFIRFNDSFVNVSLTFSKLPQWNLPSDNV